MKNRYTVVGIDFSLAGTGLCIHNAGEEPVCFLVKSSKKDSTIDTVRAEMLTDRIIDLLEKNCFGFVAPESVVVLIEDYAFAAKGSITRIAEACGVLKYRMREIGIPSDQVLKVAPAMLKKITCGSGIGKKGLMMLNVFKRWGYDAKDDNEADAYALVKFGGILKKPHACMSKYEKEATSKLIATNKAELGDMEWLQCFAGETELAETKARVKVKKSTKKKRNSEEMEVVDMEETIPMKKKILRKRPQ